MTRFMLTAALALSVASIPAGAQDVENAGEAVVMCECQNPEGQVFDTREDDIGTTYACLAIGMPTGLSPPHDWHWSCSWHPMLLSDG